MRSLDDLTKFRTTIGYLNIAKIRNITVIKRDVEMVWLDGMINRCFANNFDFSF